MCSRGPAQKMLSDLTYNELKNYDVLKSVLANQVIQRRKETYLRHRCQILWNWRKIFSNSNREIEHHSIQTYNLSKSKQNILLYYIQRALSRKCFCQTLQAFFLWKQYFDSNWSCFSYWIEKFKKNPEGMLARWTSNLETCDNELVQRKALICRQFVPYALSLLTVSTVNLTHLLLWLQKQIRIFSYH